MPLPDSVLRKKKFPSAWSPADVPDVIREAAIAGFACTAGQFQFHTYGPTCDCYWLDVVADRRREEESWTEYVARCEQEMLEGFRKRWETTDWQAEVRHWRDTIYAQRAEEGVDPRTMLVFEAYFSREDDVLRSGRPINRAA